MPDSLDCNSSPTGQLLRAFGEFNRGDWFECHETLEDLWIGSQGEMRDFYQGILQIAVALHHWRNGNFGGAVHLLAGGAGYLRRVQNICQRMQVGELVAQADLFREELVNLGPEQMAGINSALVPRLQLAPAKPETQKLDINASSAIFTPKKRRPPPIHVRKSV